MAVVPNFYIIKGITGVEWSLKFMPALVIMFSCGCAVCGGCMLIWLIHKYPGVLTKIILPDPDQPNAEYQLMTVLNRTTHKSVLFWHDLANLAVMINMVIGSGVCTGVSYYGYWSYGVQEVKDGQRSGADIILG